MIAEKPSWVRHEGMQIFSIDIQPGGLRFATGGGDHKVRVWNMESVGRNLAKDESTLRLLATLRDHFGSVNCVRWAKHGRFVASGSDDQVILIHERKPGSGTTEFGSGEPPDVENWKVAMTLRGHTADVVDLPDDSMLASGSLDNTIHIWNMSNGICTAVLRGHSSLVKGVAWDPIGSFIATQSDDKIVVIWRTSDWSLAHKTEGHCAKSLGSTFFCSLDGTVATFHFEVKELGHKLSDAELDELKRRRYGDARCQQANLAESPAQLLLEAASAKQTSSKKVALDVQQNQIPVKSSLELGVPNKSSDPQNNNEKKSGLSASDGLNKTVTPARVSNPVKQREYRRADGRKRIIPEVVGVPIQQENTCGSAQSQALDFPVASSDPRNNGKNIVPTDGSLREAPIKGTVGRSFDLKECSGVTAQATVTDSRVIEKVSVGQDHNINVEPPGSMKPSGSTVGSTKSLSIRIFDKKEGDDINPVCLEACPWEHAGTDIVGVGNACMTKDTEIVCTRGSQTLWSDRISGKVSVLAGNTNFWAVGCEDGCLQVRKSTLFQPGLYKVWKTHITNHDDGICSNFYRL